jgi:pimeloyl-ACP methyl ester carboxylesterase
MPETGREAAMEAATGLAYDDDGAGTPVVLLHGLTFDRRTWRPIVERLDGSVRSIAIDLPAHGESGGAPAPLDEIAARVHELLVGSGVERPVVVGHSMMAGLAFLYAVAYPARGIVVVDNGPELRPFAELARRLEPALRGPGFAEVWPTFESSLGLERIPEPVRSLVLDAHDVEQETVVGYWETMLRTDPRELQAWIDTEVLPRLDIPCLGVFGRPTTQGERERFARLPDVQLEVWAGHGHLVHLVDPDRFAARLRRFVDHCTAPD